MTSEESTNTLDFAMIQKLLPHRPPLLLVDRVLEVDEKKGKSIHAIKAISNLDPVFAGHFPGSPVLPGVYIIEGLAQASALLSFHWLNCQGRLESNLCLLTSVEKARFRKPVVPGDVLHYFVTLERTKHKFAWYSGIAKVDGEIVAETKFSAILDSSLEPKAGE